MLSLAFNLIFVSQVIKICVSLSFVVALMLVHDFILLDCIGVEFKFI